MFNFRSDLFLISDHIVCLFINYLALYHTIIGMQENSAESKNFLLGLFGSIKALTLLKPMRGRVGIKRTGDTATVELKRPPAQFDS
jgi:hypothetical protein